ncbi:MAG: hypothetical protein R3F11_32205 [Verrucomicrobiales bacterium]
MKQGDARGYAEVFSQRSDQRAALQEATALGALPVESIDLTLARGQDVRWSGDKAKAAVKMRIVFRGLAKGNVFETFAIWELERAGAAGLRIASIEEGGIPGFWKQGYSGWRTSPNFAVAFKPGGGGAKEANEVLAEAERSLARLKASGIPAVGPYLIVIAESKNEFGMMVRADARDAPGATSGLPTTAAGGDKALLNHAFYLNRDALKKYVKRGKSYLRENLIAHEIFHLCMMPYDSPATPWWVREGVAVFLSNEFTESNAEFLAMTSGENKAMQLAMLTIKSADDRYNESKGGYIDVEHYLYAKLAIAALADRFGMPKVIEFYKAAGEAKSASGAAAIARANQLCKKHFGITMGEIDQMVAARTRP